MSKVRHGKSGGKMKPKAPAIRKSRKVIRKEQRKEKKARRSQWFQRKQAVPQKDPGVTEGKGPTQRKKDPDQEGQVNSNDVSQDQRERMLKTERQKQDKLKSEMQKSRKKQLLAANEDEDRNIKHLEKLLKLNRHKRKSLPKSFDEDGLGYLLEVCDSDNLKDAVKTEQALQDSGSEFEEDFAIVTAKNHKGKKKIKKTKNGDDGTAQEDNSCDESESNDGEYESEDDGENEHDEVNEEEEDDGSMEELSDSEMGGSDFGLGADDGTDSEVDNHEEVESAEDRSSKKGRKCVTFQDIPPTKRKIDDSAESLPQKDALRALIDKKNGDHVRKKQKTNLKNAVAKYEEDPNESDSDGSIHENDSCFDSEGDDIDIKDETSEKKVKNNVDGTWEDIYGRTRSVTGDVVQSKQEKYIPPALRAKVGQEGDSKRQEQLLRLRRQMKGLLNRLAENNLATIASQMEEMYMSHSQHDMNDTFMQLTTEALVSHVLTPERLVMEHVLLITVLQANVGTEVGAHFLQCFMKSFIQLLESAPPVEQKEIDNITCILSHLYNFKVFSASLMFEVLDRIAEEFNEKRVELILLVLRSVGFSLRKDDPLALKSLILHLQSKAATASHTCDSSRVKFMLDILLAIKNNNMSKIPSYNPEHIEHLKKLMRSLVRRGNYVTELKIALDDLLKAEERGRWWIVGSAWTGHLPGENPSTVTQNTPGQAGKTEVTYSSKLLELARKQRMNTGVRKDIFCILMTAEDYLDAFEKLLHLNLKNQQRQEIVNVIFDCCLQEKTFNPYYAHMAQKFCDFDRQYQMKFQYRLWDKLKDLDELSSSQLSNLAQLLAHLLLEKGLPISALKVISFADMDKACVRLVRQVLLLVLLAKDEDAFEAVFRRVAPSPQLRLFREGLRLFISHFVLRNSRGKSLPDDNLVLLNERAKKANAILMTSEARIQF